MRKKFIIANWKMNLSLNEASDFALKLKSQAGKKNYIDIAICPPFLYITNLINIFEGSKIQLGAQNVFFKEKGAYTGEISPKMLKDLQVKFVIIGHSERRLHFHETDEAINQKIKSALNFEITPIFCVGENLNTRENRKAKEFVKKQVLEGIKDLTHDQIEKIIIAYEPIWAIGTGKICSGKDANEIIEMIRNTIKETSSSSVSEKVRILYGGSIKSDNFSEHVKYPDIDGGLVGGASLSLDEFIKIINLAEKEKIEII